MNQQGGTGMTAHMVGYPLFDTTQSGQLSKLLIHFRVARQSGKTSDIRITVKNAQCPAFKQQMQRQTDFHPCLNGFEVQPPFAVYPNEILRCELAEVRIAQSGITAEQEELMPIANLGSKGLLRKGVLSPILVCNKDSVQEVCVVRLASSSNAYIGMILYVYWGGSTGLFFINSKTGNSYIIRKVNGSMISEIEFKRKNDHLFVRSKTNTASFRVSALFLDTTGVDLSLSMNIVDENLDDAEDIEIL